MTDQDSSGESSEVNWQLDSILFRVDLKKMGKSAGRGTVGKD